jgi:uncharacterized membrane protein
MLDPNLAPARPSRRRLIVTVIAVALAVVVAALFLESAPHSILDKADRIGFAICHQIPERSYFLAGRQLPLCARCTGTFLGAVIGLAALLIRRRGRASNLPPAGVLLILVAFMGLWAADGLNSYLGFIPGAPQLYEPRNWLRLATGMLNGLALAALIFPILNFTLWRNPDPQPAIKNGWEVLAILPPAAVAVWLVEAQIDALLYPIALLSTGGVLMLLTSINAMLAAVVLRLEGRARTARHLLLPLGVGLALALLELMLLAALRTYLVTHFGLVIQEPGK